MYVKTNAAATRGLLTCIETRDRAGNHALPHVHRRSVEAFYVLRGSYTFTAGRQRYACRAGAFVCIPPGRTHAYVAGPRGGRLLIMYAPAGLDDLFRELAGQPRNSPLSVQNAIAERFHTRYLVRTG
jgi:quercetin dioxygenase-like cupin family protein